MKCAPPNFVGKGVGNLVKILVRTPWLSDKIARRLQNLIPFIDHDIADRYARFILIGSEKSQEHIYEYLLEKSRDWPDMQFVVLSLDMDFMGAGIPPMNFRTQLIELFGLKLRFPNKLLPFICVDPRRDNAEGLREMVKEYIEKRGFLGIKLYPPLGFYPFDPKLEKVYDYSVENNIPIISHCDIGGIYYHGELTTEHLKPQNINAKGNTFDFTHEKKIKNKDFSKKFTHPQNYREVLTANKEYGNLKFCLAHYGGSQMIFGDPKKTRRYGEWYPYIKVLLREFPNVYTDISYTLWNAGKKKDKSKVIMNRIKTDIDDDDLGKKILFGTDFFMTIREKYEKNLILDLKSDIGPDRWKVIAEQNPKIFLDSAYFKPH